MTDDSTITLEREAERPRAAGGRGPGVLVLCSEGEIPGSAVHAAIPRLSIGRRADQDIFLEDQGLSRQHALICFEEARITLRDLGGRNGTFLNGQRLSAAEERPLAPGDVIRCGSTLLLLVADVDCYAGWPATACREPLLGGPALGEVLRAIDVLAPQQLEVLITGESGTGKELVATLLHQRSGRSGQLVTVNCAALPAPLFEAELFGVRRGAFTGAVADRPGLFRLAHGGTLLLDEIGELPLELQPKLLRVLEQHHVQPVGGVTSAEIDTRVIAATNRDLTQERRAGHFREDLFHRICGAHLDLPPLRERRDDILLLAQHLAARLATPPLPLSVEAAETLLLYRWPGNVRELVQVVQAAQLQAHGEQARAVRRQHLRAQVTEVATEKDRVRKALEQAGGNVLHAASDLGISRGKLYRLLSEHGIQPADFRRRGRR